VLFFRLTLLYISVLLIGSGLIFILSSKSALYSFIVAFVSSSIVVLASFKNYKTMVSKRLVDASGDEFDDRDVVDKIEDPYGLYDDLDNNDLQEKEDDKSFKDIIKEEKQRLKEQKRPLKQSIADSARAFNYIRLIAYTILVAGFFILLKSKNLNMAFYLATLILPNIIAIVFLMKINSGNYIEKN